MGIGKTKRDRRREMRAAVRRIAAVLFIGMLIVGAMYGYNYATTSARFSVTTVEFGGLTRLDDDSLDRLLADLVGTNLFLAPLDAYEARIEAHPRVARATLHRVVPGRIKCNVTEREPVALLFADRFLEVDAEGMVMPDDGFTEVLDLPIITGLARGEIAPGEFTDSPRLRRALEALELCRRFGGDFATGISEVHLDRNGVSIHSLERDRVLVLGDGDYERRLRKYFLMQETIQARDGEARLIDLRFDDQVVLRGRI